MRTSETTTTAASDGLHRHVCLAYDDAAELDAEVRSFLADGLARGLQVRYLSGGDLVGLRERMVGFGGGVPDAFRIDPLTGTYRPGEVAEPRAQVRAYAAATENALAAGFAGLRVVAEATPLVATPPQLDAFARYEHLIGRFMTTRPFSALCAYHRPELGAATIAQLACLHPEAATRSSAAPFRLHPAPGGAAVLAGEVDMTVLELFGCALDRAHLVPVDGELVLDGSALTFIDHRGLLALADLARRRSATVVLRTPLHGPRRIVDLLGIGGVRVEVTS